MTKEQLIVEKFKIESMIIDIDVEMLYLEEEKYNLQRDLDIINKELQDVIN